MFNPVAVSNDEVFTFLQAKDYTAFLFFTLVLVLIVTLQLIKLSFHKFKSKERTSYSSFAYEKTCTIINETTREQIVVSAAGTMRFNT